MRRGAFRGLPGPAVALLAALAVLAGCARPATVLPATGGGPIPIRGEVRGLVAADPEGGGRPRLFALFEGELAEVGIAGGTYTLIRRYAAFGVRWTGIGAGDVDGDGRDEIALTGFMPQVASAVLGAGEGGALVARAAGVPLYLRIARLPGGGGIGLACERPAAEEPYLPPPMRCAVRDGRVERGDPLALPPGVHLDDFVVVPQAAGEALYTVGEDGRWSRRHGGDALWRSDARWTARPVAVERSFSGLLGETTTRLHAFSTYPLVADLDADGRAEVWQPTADEAPFTVLSRLRIFRGGSWLRLDPEGYGLAVRRSGPLLGQATVGLAPWDVTGDGIPEVVAAAILRPRTHPAGPRSTFMAYDVGTGRPVGPGAPSGADAAVVPEPAPEPLPAPEPAPDVGDRRDGPP